MFSSFLQKSYHSVCTMLYLFYNQKTTSVIFFFLKKRCQSSNAGPSRESQVLSSNLYFAMNKPYFVHHKEETMSSVFSSDYRRAAFSERSGNRRQAGQRLSCYQPQSTHYQACQSRGDRKITTDWSGSLGTT